LVTIAAFNTAFLLGEEGVEGAFPGGEIHFRSKGSGGHGVGPPIEVDTIFASCAGKSMEQRHVTYIKCDVTRKTASEEFLCRPSKALMLGSIGQRSTWAASRLSPNPWSTRNVRQ
jgi:hypothetical protein